MRLFKKTKDGGPESPVDAYFLIEIKSLFSIALLKFNKGRREQYHTHAFNAWTWLIKGALWEERRYDNVVCSTFNKYKRSFKPKLTTRDNNHRVEAVEDSWCFTLRGPWSDTWTEDDLEKSTKTTFTHGRQIIREQ